MDEIAASSSRWRAALAFSFSAARLSAGAVFSVAFGGIAFVLQCKGGHTVPGDISQCFIWKELAIVSSSPPPPPGRVVPRRDVGAGPAPFVGSSWPPETQWSGI